MAQKKKHPKKKHPCGYFFPSHKWTKWSKIARRGPNKGTQQRHCGRCGLLQSRIGKVSRFHIHRWKLDRRMKGSTLRCKTCQITKEGVTRLCYSG